MPKPKSDQDYFAEGQEAHREGTSRVDNPYSGTKNSNGEAQWDSGWDAEQEVSYGD